MYDDLLSLSPEAMVSACRREGIHWLVIVKGRSGPVDESEQTVKVKSVLRGSEDEGSPRPSSIRVEAMLIDVSQSLVRISPATSSTR